MAEHVDTGRKGEQLAADWFTSQLYHIIEQNWRYQHYELDIIAEKNGVLHFIEVKTLHNTRFGFPEARVDKAKIRRMIAAAQAYVRRHPKWQRIQFDILSVTIGKEKTEYFLVEDIFV